MGSAAAVGRGGGGGGGGGGGRACREVEDVLCAPSAHDPSRLNSVPFFLAQLVRINMESPLRSLISNSKIVEVAEP